MTLEIATSRSLVSAEVTPVISGFHPDPTICRVGDDYYLATSSFGYFPAVPLYHSTNLVDWEPIGHALDRRDQLPNGIAGDSGGIYAPTLRHHGGHFWLATTNASDLDAGQLIVHAEDPAGPWSDPVHVADAIGIDPDLVWDDDGTCLLTWHHFTFDRGGIGVLQAPIDPLTGELLSDPYPVWQGTGMVAAEGPHVIRKDGYWYQFLAEGGTERGHSTTVARSRNPRGPFEPCPHNPVLTRRSSGHIVQNAGHADLVQQPDGSWAAVYLGVRPRGTTPMYHVLGRETFLAGIDWVDGWPVFDGSRFCFPAPDKSFVDTFEADQLDVRWVGLDADPNEFAAQAAQGLTLAARDGERGLLCTRVTDFAWEATAEAVTDARLALRLDARHWAAVMVVGGRVSAEVRIGDITQELAADDGPATDIVLGIRASEPQQASLPNGTSGPDDITLFALIDGRERELARLDGRYFSTEVAAGFSGRVLALGIPGRETSVRKFRYLTTSDEQGL